MKMAMTEVRDLLIFMINDLMWIYLVPYDDKDSELTETKASMDIEHELRGPSTRVS